MEPPAPVGGYFIDQGRSETAEKDPTDRSLSGGSVSRDCLNSEVSSGSVFRSFRGLSSDLALKMRTEAKQGLVEIRDSLEKLGNSFIDSARPPMAVALYWIALDLNFWEKQFRN